MGNMILKTRKYSLFIGREDSKCSKGGIALVGCKDFRISADNIG